MVMECQWIERHYEKRMPEGIHAKGEARCTMPERNTDRYNENKG